MFFLIWSNFRWSRIRQRIPPPPYLVTNLLLSFFKNKNMANKSSKRTNKKKSKKNCVAKVSEKPVVSDIERWPKIKGPKGCKHSRYGKDPKNPGRNLLLGCECVFDISPTCSTYYPVYPVINETPSTDGYSDTPRECVQNSLRNVRFYKGLKLFGYMGFRDGDTDSIHVIWGVDIFPRNYSTNCQGELFGFAGNVQYHHWLEDEDGLVYDHVDPMAFKIGSSVGADVSKVTPFQRFVGVSKETLLDSFGVWYCTEENDTTDDLLVLSEWNIIINE